MADKKAPEPPPDVKKLEKELGQIIKEMEESNRKEREKAEKGKK